MNFKFKEKYDTNDLIGIVRILRSPDGCPWDKVQTHQSIRKDFIEEVYEAVDAIDSEDSEHLREELGDVLLQVVFHSVLAEEENSFVYDDVVDDICKKMIIRHPHVFGDVNADTTEQVLKNWDTIKMKTHDQTTVAETMESVSKTMPSLMRAQKLHKKAGKCALFRSDKDRMFAQVQSVLEKLHNLPDGADHEEKEKLIGELLFSVSGLSSSFDVDGEQSLYNACDDFIGHFAYFEACSSEEGVNIQDLSEQQASQLWENINN